VVDVPVQVVAEREKVDVVLRAREDSILVDSLDSTEPRVKVLTTCESNVDEKNLIIKR